MYKRSVPNILPAQLASALMIGTIAVLMVGVQPILLGALVDTRHVSLEGVGIVAMAEIIMLGIGVALGEALLPSSWLRQVTIIAALCAAALDLLTLYAVGDGDMAAVRAGAGLAEGLLVWGTTGVIVRTSQPARIGGIFFVLQTVAQAALGLALANMIIPRWGWQGGFVALAALALLPCVLAYFQPAHLSPLPPAQVSGFRWSSKTMLPLAVAFFQLAALGAFWAYLEPLGQAVGLDARGAQSLVAMALVMQVVGGTIATLAIRRLPLILALLACSIVLAVVTITVHQLPTGSIQTFSIACGAFGFVWLFMLPFHIGLAFRADSSGRLGGLIPAAQLLGSAFGPLVASFLVNGNDASAVPLISTAFALVSGVLVILSRAHRGV